MEKRFLTALLFTFAFITYVLGQENSRYEKVYQTKGLNVEFIDISSSLAKAGEEIAMRKYFTHPESVSYFHYTPMELNSENRAIRLTIPIEGKDRVLELTDVSDSFYDYEIETQDGEVRKADRSIRHFRGIIDGIPNSFAAISLNKNKISGILSTNEGNYSIASMQRSKKVVVYNDQNIKSRSSFICGTTDDYPISYSSDILMENFLKNSQSVISGKVLRIYLETRYNIYQSRGSINAVEEYISSIVNQLSALFQKEGILLHISKIYIWSEQDPYSGNVYSLLSQFQSQRTKSGFDGDLGQLLTFENIGGVAAGYNGLCNPDASRKLSVAGISRSGDDLPSSFNWSVCVMAHELGHLLGSKHTHACAWNGNNTAIDGCYETEGNCTKPAIPTNGGTIMSYCHLQDCGINLSLGFGSQPGNVIRNSVRKAACLSGCSISGPTVVCNQGTYTIQNLPSGSSVRWSTNNGNLQLVSGQGTKTAVFRKSGSGECVIQAQVASSGPAITHRTWVGVPSRVDNIEGMIEGAQLEPNSPYVFSIDNAQNTDRVEWAVGGGQIESGQGTNRIFVKTEEFGRFYIWANRINRCGEGGYHKFSGTIIRREYFTLSPNPAVDVVTLQLTKADGEHRAPSSPSAMGTTNTYEIQLWSGLAMLRSFQTNQPTFQIPIAGLPAGLYFVRVIKDGQTYTEKLIKN